MYVPKTIFLTPVRWYRDTNDLRQHSKVPVTVFTDD